MNRILSYACLALSMALVGSYVALSKPLVAVFPVFLLAWLRFGIGGVAMRHWLKRPADEAPMTRRTRRTRQLIFLESFLGNFLFSLCMLYGVSLSSAVAAGVIMASIPAAVAVLSWLFLGERIRPRVGLAVAWAWPWPAPCSASYWYRYQNQSCMPPCNKGLRAIWHQKPRGWATCCWLGPCCARRPMR
jgi:drug/metabolite transporter (DMT)-like permease